MKKSDIITIMQTNDHAERSVLTVTVKSVEDRGDGYLVNDLVLPKEPHTGEIPRRPNFIGWFPFIIKV